MSFATKAEIRAAADRSNFLADECHGFDVPNMDAMDTDDLAALEWTLDQLSKYADHKRRARALRVKGDIQAALSWEQACQNVYISLPVWARW